MNRKPRRVLRNFAVEIVPPKEFTDRCPKM
jgi:hypothetical protein